MNQPERQQHGPDGSVDYLRVIRERAWVIVLSIVVVVGAALAMSFTSTPTYRATSQIVFQTNTLDRTLFGAQVFGDANQPRSLETAAKLVKVPQVAEAVKKQLASPLSSAQLLSMIEVNTSSIDNLVQIEATGTDPATVTDVSNAFAQQFVLLRKNADQSTIAAAAQLVKEQLDRLTSTTSTIPTTSSTTGSTDSSTTTTTAAWADYAASLWDKYQNLQILEAMQTGGFTIVQEAVEPSAPFSPQPTRNGIMAVAIGLVLGLGLAFLLNHLDKRVKDLKSLEHYVSAPVLATIPLAGGRWRRRGRKESKAIGFARDPWLLESFRALRSSLEYLDIDSGTNGNKNKKFLITSGLPGEGKSATAINLSLSLALAGNRVVLVECDLRQPSIARYLELRKESGLSTVLTEKTTLNDALQVVDVLAFVPPAIRERAVVGDGLPGGGDLRCLTSGPIPPNPAEILSSKRVESVLQQIAGECDFLVIDTPPVLSVADALILSPKVDGVLIQARMHWATREELQETSEQLRRSGGRVIGVVAGGVKAKALPYRAQTYYRYGHT